MATDEGKGTDPRVEEIFARVPKEVLSSLSEEQTTAFSEAIGMSQKWGKHPIDIRLSIPLGPRRMYLTVVGGTEGRAADRRAQDRRLHPVRTTSNMIFLGAAVVALYVIAGIVALIVAGVVRSG